MYNFEREPEIPEYIADTAQLVSAALRGVELYSDDDRIDTRAQEQLRPLLPLVAVDGMTFRVTPTEKKFSLPVDIMMRDEVVAHRQIRAGVISRLEREASKAIRRRSDSIPFFEGNILDIDPKIPNMFVVTNSAHDLRVSCMPYFNSTELIY